VITRPELDKTLQPVALAACGQDGNVTLTSTQSGAIYTLSSLQGEKLATVNSSGGEINFTVPQNTLKAGENEFIILASFKGCAEEALNEKVVIEFTDAPKVNVENMSVCKGSSAVLKVSADQDQLVYTWYDQDGNKIKGAESATFETDPISEETFVFVSAELPGGCKGPQQMITITPEEIEEPVLYQSQDTLHVTAMASEFIWTIGGRELQRTTTPYLILSEKGEYAVTCVKGGCTKTSATLPVTELQFRIAPGEVTVYPNPAPSDDINVRGNFNYAAPVSIKVIDAAGKEMFTTSEETIRLNGGVKLQSQGKLKAGMYFLILEENSKKRKIKFIVTD
jgi:hypothetical protein